MFGYCFVKDNDVFHNKSFYKGLYTFLVHRYCNLVLSIVLSLLPALVMLAPRENAIFSNPCCRKKKTKQNKYLPLIIQEEERFFILNQPPFTICFNKKKKKKKERKTAWLCVPSPRPSPPTP